jgi:hypothetical protein
MSTRRNTRPHQDLLPRPSLDDLRGRQSVRATFRLSEASIDALSILSAHLGIKQKSLFDHLMEDTDALQTIARDINNRTDSLNGNRLQKTFVISRRSLRSLDEISKQFHASRDELVEFSVQRLWPIIARERKKQDQREALFARIKQHFSQAPLLLDDIEHLLGKDDLMYKKMENAVAAYQDAVEAMAAFVEKARKIENFPMEKFQKPDEFDS